MQYDFTPATPEQIQSVLPQKEGVTPSREGFRRFFSNPVAVISLVLVILVSLAAFILPGVWPYSYDRMLGFTPGYPMDPGYNNLAPFAYSPAEQQRIAAGEQVFPHLFGTDSQGRDYFIRVVYGTRISLTVGFFASLIVLVIGLAVGAIAGYFGGKTDLLIMRVVDVIYSLPDTLMVILLSAVLKVALGDTVQLFGKLGSNMVSLFIVFALLYWVSTARLVRGQILNLRQQEYVLAARTAGAGGKWIIRRHLLPNCLGVLVVSTALQIPGAIFTESYLSFLGLGVNAPMPSLGSLAADALNGITSYPQRLVIPAVTISIIVLSLNLLGDGLRDAFDPKLREGR